MTLDLSNRYRLFIISLLLLASIVLGLYVRLFFTFASIFINGLFVGSDPGPVSKLVGIIMIVIYGIIVFYLNKLLIRKWHIKWWISGSLFIIASFIGMNDKVYNALLALINLFIP